MPRWDPSAIDPRLFSQTSELAGALTLSPPVQLPHPRHAPVHHGDGQQTPYLQQPPSSAGPSSAPPPPPPGPEVHPVLAEVLKTLPNLDVPTRFTSGPTVPVMHSPDGPLPPRFCSIKGCKTLIAGNSFFKMCEPCRDRYRNYGTKKRAKWKREKEVAVEELNKLRFEEDVRRAEQGLPPLAQQEWREFSPSGEPGEGGEGDAGQPGPSVVKPPVPLPPRMCTVSHCREILPGDYQFLRCERHRIQNRHHSKLKRVRDKDAKIQAHDGWAAVVDRHGESSIVGEPSADLDAGDESAGGEDGADGGVAPGGVVITGEDLLRALGALAGEIPGDAIGPGYQEQDAQDEASQHVELQYPQELGPEHIQGADGEPDEFDPEYDADVDPDYIVEDTPLGEPTNGLPPAARGMRRTNHVCSIKACANLLSPNNPWKMCDLCRSRDRAGRRLKALRDSGLISAEVAAGKILEIRSEVEGKEKEKSARRKSKGGDDEGEVKEKPARKEKTKKAKKAGVDAADDAGGDAAVAGPSGESNQSSFEGSTVPPAVAPDSTNFIFMEPMLTTTHPSQLQYSMVSCD